MGVRIVALTYLASFGTRAPLFSAMRDGWRYRDGVAETYLDHLSMDMMLSSNMDFFRLGIN